MIFQPIYENHKFCVNSYQQLNFSLICEHKQSLFSIINGV